MIWLYRSFDSDSKRNNYENKVYLQDFSKTLYYPYKPVSLQSQQSTSSQSNGTSGVLLVSTSNVGGGKVLDWSSSGWSNWSSSGRSSADNTWTARGDGGNGGVGRHDGRNRVQWAVSDLWTTRSDGGQSRVSRDNSLNVGGGVRSSRGDGGNSGDGGDSGELHF